MWGSEVRKSRKIDHRIIQLNLDFRSDSYRIHGLQFTLSVCVCVCTRFYIRNFYILFIFFLFTSFLFALFVTHFTFSDTEPRPMPQIENVTWIAYGIWYYYLFFLLFCSFHSPIWPFLFGAKIGKDARVQQISTILFIFFCIQFTYFNFQFELLFSNFYSRVFLRKWKSVQKTQTWKQFQLFDPKYNHWIKKPKFNKREKRMNQSMEVKKKANAIFPFIIWSRIQFI